MTKSEKSVLKDIAGMLNAILTSNSNDDQPTEDLKNLKQQDSPGDDWPSQEEIDFVRELANDGKTVIKGCAINLTKRTVGVIRISSDCLSRLLEAYLEIYDHE